MFNNARPFYVTISDVKDSKFYPFLEYNTKILINGLHTRGARGYYFQARTQAKMCIFTHLLARKR